MVTIIFEAHSTTTDNEAHLASGWNDVALSELGLKQSVELGQRYSLDDIDAIFASDMERAFQTATLAFPSIEPRKLHIDWRLRECDYGDLTQHPKSEVDREKLHRVDVPFPNGESYTDTTERMRTLLLDLARDYQDKKVMIIGHRATQYGLEHWINGVPLQDAVTAPWSWQAGWTYEWKAVPELTK
jgi:broad specificity phosphatase PhoE